MSRRPAATSPIRRITTTPARVLTRLTGYRDRLYADFVMPSRLDAYKRLLERALLSGYEVLPVGEFWRRAVDGHDDPGARVLLLRHDIDTDPGTARAMWSIDRNLGIRSSYFFRQSTLDLDLMAAIEAEGGEASYHYEELSTVMRQRGVRDRVAAVECVPEARDQFAHNIVRLRGISGLPMRVVASHGDFVNRKVGISNWAILTDLEFRREMGIVLETYDRPFLERLPLRYTDGPHPRYWDPSDPAVVLATREPVVSLLTHPRHWRTDLRINARDDATRAIDELRYRLPLPRPSTEAPADR